MVTDKSYRIFGLPKNSITWAVTRIIQEQYAE